MFKDEIERSGGRLSSFQCLIMLTVNAGCLLVPGSLMHVMYGAFNRVVTDERLQEQDKQILSERTFLVNVLMSNQASNLMKAQAEAQKASAANAALLESIKATLTFPFKPVFSSMSSGPGMFQSEEGQQRLAAATSADSNAPL